MKRFLAIMIAAMLVVGMLPTAFAGDVPESGYKYNLTTNSLTSNTVTKNGALGYISWEGESPTVITDEDEPGFATTGRNNLRDINPGIYDGGFASGLTVGKNDTSYFDNIENEELGTRAFCLIKIYVPTGGKYTFTALNSFTSDLPSEHDESKYTVKDNIVDEGAVPTVHMVKVTAETPDLTYHNNNTTNCQVTNVGTLGFSENTVIGSYDSRKLATDASVPVRTKVGEVELDAGVYYVLFDLDSAAATANKDYWKHNNGTWFQLFLLSGIELTPVADEGNDTGNDTGDDTGDDADDDTDIDSGNVTEESVTYEFGIKSGAAADASVSSVKYSNTNNKWSYRAASSDKLGNSSQVKNGRMLVSSTAAGMWLALEISIPQSGWYEIQFSSFRIKNNGGVGDVYILPENADLTDVEAAISASGAVAVAKDVKYYDTEKSSETVKEKAVLGHLVGKKKIILFRATEKNTADGAKNVCNMYPASVSLKWLGKEEPPYSLIPSKTKLVPGEKAELSLVNLENSVVSDWSVKEIETSDESVATVDGKTVTAGNEAGTVTINATVIADGVEKEAQGTLSVIKPTLATDLFDRGLAIGETVILDKSAIEWGTDAPEYSDNVTLSYENKTPEIIQVSDSGVVTTVGYGIGEVLVTASWNGYEIIWKCNPVVGTAKTGRSFYTDEKIKNLQNNIARYEWAQDERDKYVEEADKLLEHGVDKLYSMITTQELPRATQIAYRFNDNGHSYCLYCDKNVQTESGNYPWNINVFTRPWKIQCPDCKRLFPSNDFGKFYELGIDEHGNYRFTLALQRHHEKFVCEDGENCECAAPAGERGSEEWNAYYGYGVKGGYLYNDTYSEKDDALFAVDDGWGYEYTYTYKKADGTPELNEDGSVKTEARCKPFIAYYNMWGLWEIEIEFWVKNLSMAYLYTNDIRYGRVAAILIDRIADIYPDFDTTECGKRFLVNDGNTISWKAGKYNGASRGKIMGNLHEHELMTQTALAYDAVFDILSDSEIISYLSQKAEEFNLENKKTTANDIARNIENNFLREAHKCFLDGRAAGNFGVPQRCHLVLAVVLDTFPETEEWINWVFQSGVRANIYEYTGGNVNSQIVNVSNVDRDGHGNEASPSYNGNWVYYIVEIADVLDGYDKVANVNLYEHPKLIRMLTSQMEILCVSTAAPNIGDHDRIGLHLPAHKVQTLLTAFGLIEDEETRKNLARATYLLAKKDMDSVHGSIFEAEPEALREYVDEVAKSGQLALKLGSRALTGYGISILRDGDWYLPNDSSKNVNTQRDFYLWYGQTNGHGDLSKLNLGFHAFGLDVGADIGEARLKNSTDPHRFEMQDVTVSHNTVTVNDVSQIPTLDGNVEHFDDAGRVKVMDAEAPEVYASQGVEEYKRTLVMVDADDDISYGVDFFHVRGGEDHLYSFHTLATEGTLSDNVEIQSQTDDNGSYIGSYQGEDKKWGGSTVKDDSDGLGTYSWFGEVDRATDPANADVFSMDWKIVDIEKVLSPSQKNLHVRLTMLNSFKLDEITTTSGIPPQVTNAPQGIRFLFARHTGQNDGKAANAKLDTLFTSVVEPYNKDRYIENIEKVNVTRADGAEFTMDEAKAVKVTLTNGRVDYIVYAKDTTVPYKVYYSENESFDFCGFVGVVSMVDGKITYTYVNDGTTIADKENLIPAYEGKVTGFQTKLDADNWMDIDFGGDIAFESLTDKYVYVENGLSDNAAYLIESAELSPDIDGSVRLYLGNTTLITGYADEYDFDKGFNYNIKVTDKARIPLSYVDDTAPVFEPISDSITTSAGSSITVSLKANSEHGAVTYSSVTLPRGASINSDTGAITWKPDASQVGENLVQVEAVDVFGRVTRANFTITVYGSTTSKPETESSGDTTTPAGGGGGGGGGAAPTDKPDTDDESLLLEEKVPSTGEADEVENGDNDNIRFTDLGNHAWAADAINTLAADGIIKGTTASTFSPASNITRADFALLLVRAFKLESDNAENFADVSAADYFAQELAVARNTGIVNGIGENKFAPRNTITRQDMMVIVYRALQSQSLLLEEKGDRRMAVDEVLSQYSDFTSVAPYAKEAVSSLINAGLVNGKNGRIAPTDYTTRAEVAVLVKRTLDYAK
ncbi:MAG: S-layer homology domain-containing protein [Oscillospiraceae bacterium]|nr:S-layer homology domain-containing protein [Oscillospiraceae bacterium]